MAMIRIGLTLRVVDLRSRDLARPNLWPPGTQQLEEQHAYETDNADALMATGNEPFMKTLQLESKTDSPCAANPFSNQTSFSLRVSHPNASKVPLASTGLFQQLRLAVRYPTLVKESPLSEPFRIRRREDSPYFPCPNRPL